MVGGDGSDSVRMVEWVDDVRMVEWVDDVRGRDEHQQQPHSACKESR